MNPLVTVHPGEVLQEEFLIPNDIDRNVFARAAAS